MKKTLLSLAALATLTITAPSAHAVVYTFNASLSGANEVLPTVGGPGSGIAILAYDTQGTVSLLDDTYDFAMSVFGLTGGTGGKAANAFHIHGAASATENGPVRVSLDGPLFTALNAGSTLLVGGSNILAPSIASTPASSVNQGYAAMSFLQMLQGGLAYVNVHTTLNPGGAVRGQLIQVSAVPEPSSYAMLLAGVAALGLLARRRAR
ncbi:CHRD domain-containing protein [Pseudaquabacterium pictum]|uniref:CHRD domain-containing protein n=1 Tax=Pseudaquabacterium pictum TaxID=2315236 RepID=A0A480AV97_9BURK|nr:CHRD domain-containing protein [Rubrivivax pictus]GCL64057.1 hypothetical protein AQPW35_31380 [Rubrivivax pictus]